jgi:N-acetyl sugar amidotransferase
MGNGEPYFHEELIHFSREFNKVILLLTEAHGNNKTFTIPDNVELIDVSVTLNFWDKLFQVVPFIFDKRFLQEIKTIKKTYNQPISLYKVRSILLYLLKSKLFVKKLDNLLAARELHPENILLYSYWLNEYTVGYATYRSKHPLAIAFTRMHGWDVYFERNPENYLPLRSYIFSNLDCAFTISEQGTQYLKKKLGTIVPPVFHLSRLGTSEPGQLNPERQNKKSFVILSLSYISQVKRLDRIIQALSGLKEYEIEWIHIGGGKKTDEDKLNALANEHLNDSKIKYTFLGNLKKEDIYKFLKTEPVDFLINSSESEGLPVAMMEAMSFGIPVIGTNVGGVSEIVTEGKTGFTADNTNAVESLREAIAKAYSLDINEYRILSANARAKWESDFNSDKNYANFTRHILSLRTREYQCCSKCILDTDDYPGIVFNSQGVCDICEIYDQLSIKNIKRGADGQKALNTLVHKIKTEGKGKEYDCIIGLSGGVDSSYLAYLTKVWGLKPLVIHVDNGWNTEMAVKNIQNILDKLGYDLFTYVLDWEEMRDVQKAFIRANVLDIDLPFDNAFMAVLYQMARKHKIKYILSGHNTATEGYLPPNFTHFKLDKINIQKIHKKFGSIPLKNFPTIGLFEKYVYDKVYKIEFYSPLDWIDYNKTAVKEFITKELNWKDYGGKHYENIFTRFYQGYILYHKFKVDKRKSHLSTLICSGQISRDEAFTEIQKPPYQDQVLMKTDKDYFIKKMMMSAEEFDEYIDTSPVTHREYGSILNYMDKLRPFYHQFNRIKKSILG